MIRFLLGAIAAGALFGTGLVMSTMTDPERVIGFLDLFGAFDPTLGLVLAGAVLFTLVAFRSILRMPKPLFAERFVLPPTGLIDGKLITGAVLFGIGWGLAGYCPGPAVAGLAAGSHEAFAFVAAMLLGSAVYGRLSERKLKATG